MTTRVTFVSGTAEVKRRKKKDERWEGGLEAVTPAQPMSYMDGKCTCCPYGYHIDLDFLNFCQDVTDGSTLTNLKRIQRTKRKLRKSMEVMLHQQQHQQHGDSATATLAPIPPPDVVHSTEASRLINMVQYEQTATNQVLRHIDSSVNATLATMDGGKSPSRPQHYTSSDSEDGYSYGPVSPVSFSSLPRTQTSPYNSLSSPSHQAAAPSPRRHHHYHPSNGDESSHFATSLSTSGRTDSMSSLSSVSTVSSEQVTGQYTSHASGMLNAQPQETATAEVRVRSEPRHTTSATAMTVEKLAATMATHFPQGDRPDGGESPSSPLSPNTTIGKASLAAIREAMAVSLQRMRELEEQVKAIPILQVRISVLKEEKRLLALQLKAKSTSASVRSIGVGEGTVDSPLTVSAPTFPYPSASSPFWPLAASPRSPRMKSPSSSATSPSQVRTVGLGDHSVLEPYLLQPHLPTGYTVTDHVVQTEVRSKDSVVMERVSLERRLPSLTVSTDLSQHTPSHQDLMESRSPVQTHFTINQIQRSSPRPLTRSIGVGDGNVLDSSLQIHEKELRTVIIGGNSGSVGKRNVGVEARVPTRSVGISYSCDDARPATRTIGVNVNYDTSGITTSLDFKGESELRMALRGVLQRNVRSVGIQCSSQAEVMDTGVQHESFNQVSVGCGGEDCRVDVDIRQPVMQRSLGMMAKPDVSNRVTSTEKDWVLDQGTNTQTVEMYNKACSTESRRTGTVATNTQRLTLRETETQTEVGVFHRLQAIQTTGINTTPILTINSSCNTISPVTLTRGVNTKAAELIVENFDIDISFDNKAINTPKEFYDAAVNTNSKELQLSVTQVESINVAGDVDGGEGNVSPKRSLTTQEQIIQRGASQASAFIGSTSSSGSLSPTSPHQLSENESVSRMVRETVYTSPFSSRQLWTSGGSSQESEAFRSTSGGESRLMVSNRGQVSENQGGGGGGLSRTTITRTITGAGVGDSCGAEGAGFRDLGSSSSGGSYRSSITRTVSGGRGEEGAVNQDDGGQGDFHSGGSFSRSIVTKAITTSGAGDRVRSEDRNQSSEVIRTVTTNEGSANSGFSGSVAGGDRMQKSTVTKTFISTAGVGGRLGSSGGGNQESHITRFVTGDDMGSGVGSQSGQSGSLQNSMVTKTITLGGNVDRGFGSDQLDSAVNLDDESLQTSTVTRTITASGGSGGHFGSGGGTGGSTVTKTIITRSMVGGDSSGRELSSASAWEGSGGVQVQHRPLTGGTSYMERFGFSKASNLASGGASLHSQKIADLSSMEGSAQIQTAEASQETEGDTSGASMEVIQGTAILQSSLSEPSLVSGQVMLVGGSQVEQDSSQNLASSGGSLQDMSSGGQSVSTESVVVKRSSSGSQLSKHRHSDGARLSRDLALDMQGAFTGRRVGSVEDFMPDDMRRFMNIEMAGSKSKSRSGGGSKSDRLMTKTVKTVTTKRTTQDGKRTVSVTKTVINPDGSVTTTSTTDLDEAETLPEGKALGHLSSVQLDLSKIVSGESAIPADSQTSLEPSESTGMTDSGCCDSSTMSSVSESRSLQGLDMAAMGSLERKQLKSIMRRSKSDSATAKKGISFAESVVGGTGSSSEEASESDAESTTSYDEGSYDSREGDITYQCRDDEAIAQGLPGAKMYDQNIRETYELSAEMQEACKVLANYLVDSTTIQTKQLNANLSVVQEEWFRVSSHKLSSAHQVEDYLSSINEISHRLLDYIVNLVDSNGNAAIHYCVSHCNFDIAGLLLDTEVCDVRRPNKAGYTPAMLASLAHIQNEDHRHAIRRLFAASDINTRAEQTGQTALMLATSQCRVDMVQLLLDVGADCNVQDMDGSTALMCACEHGHAAIAQLLLAQPDCDATLADNGVPRKRKGPSSPTPRHSPR